jgi:GPH family glycoside/pentoside/hexuronide:cation symporter
MNSQNGKSRSHEFKPTPMSEPEATEHEPIASKQDKVPFLQKLAIGFGEAASIGRQGIEHLTMPIYNVTLGVSPALIGSVLGLVRFVDAITDPLAGWISDNSSSRWGRRKPFMFCAAIICGLVFPLIWFVPSDWSEMTYVVYLFAALMIYFASYSFFDIPLVALAFEATPDYHERTKVQAFKAVFVHSMGIISAWLFFVTQLDAFDGTMAGARVAGVAVGATIIVVGLIPTLTVREGFRSVAQQEVKARDKRLSFLQFVGLTLSNKPFLMICVIQVAMGLGGAALAFTFYIMVYHVYGGDTAAGSVLYGTWFTVYPIATVVSIPLIAWISGKLGKIKTLQLFLCLNLLVAVLNWFVYTPVMPFLAITTAVLLGPSQTAYYTLIRSIVADICDHDELRTGLRREGSFGAMYSWINKFVGSFITALSGAFLVWVGFDALQGGDQDPQTIFSLRLAFSGLPLTAATAALVVLSFYPLTRDRCQKIRAELEERRGRANNALS